MEECKTLPASALALSSLVMVHIWYVMFSIIACVASICRTNP